jgi:hypothetical protein
MDLAANSSATSVIREQLTECSPPTHQQPAVAATETVTHVLTFGKYFNTFALKLFLFMTA